MAEAGFIAASVFFFRFRFCKHARGSSVRNSRVAPHPGKILSGDPSTGSHQRNLLVAFRYVARMPQTSAIRPVFIATYQGALLWVGPLLAP